MNEIDVKQELKVELIKITGDSSMTGHILALIKSTLAEVVEGILPDYLWHEMPDHYHADVQFGMRRVLKDVRANVDEVKMEWGLE